MILLKEPQSSRLSRIAWILMIAILLVPFLSHVLLAQIEQVPKPTALSSEAPSVRFEHLSVEDGMLQNSANNIMQDSNGFLWISTQGGLHRYDGYEFKTYTYTPFDTTALSESWVWSTTEASNGDIWVNTLDGGLNRLNPTTGKSKKYRHDPNDATTISSNNTFFTLEAANGDIWVSTGEGGLNYMKAGEDGVFTRFRHDPNNQNTISSDELFWITEDHEQQIWVGSSNGINRINPKTKSISRYLNDVTKTPIYEDPLNVLGQYHPPGEPDIIWLATGSGLVKLSIHTGEFKRYLIEPSGNYSNKLNYIHEVRPDPNDINVLWVGGPGTGLARFDQRTEQFTTYRHDPRDKTSLSDNMITSLFLDRSGIMWGGSGASGLNAFNPGAVNFTHIKHKADDPMSLSPGVVWVIFEDSKGSLWVGTDVGGDNYLTKFDAQTRQVVKYEHNPDYSASLLPGRLVDMVEDSGGNLWVGTTWGLCQINSETGKVQRYPRQGRERTNIRFLERNKNDLESFWISSSEFGIDLFNTKTNTFTPVPLLPDSIGYEPFTLCTYQDNNGNLWVGTQDGLFLVDTELNSSLVSQYDAQDTTSLTDNNVYFITERKQEPGILWVATASGGLNRFDTKTGISTHITKKDGLADNTIYGVIEDNIGTLWVSTNAGISNYNPTTKEIRNYGLEDGLMALEYNARSLTKGQDGTLYFGSGKGVTAFSPELLNTNKIPPQVVISDVKLFNKSISTDPALALALPSSNNQSLTLDYSQNELSIDFVALHFSNPKKNKYSYKLEGFENDWNEPGYSRSASYTNLSPGLYNFRVKASNSDGIWNEEGASIQIEVLPPWYRTWWAYILFAFLLGIGIFGVDRLQRSRISRKEDERAALRDAELRAEAENKRRADTEELSKIGRAITSNLSVEKIIETVYENVNALMAASVFGVGIYNKEKNSLDFPATKEAGEVLPAYSNNLDNEHLSGWCFKNKEEIIISDLKNEYSKYLKSYSPPIEGKSPDSILYLPLIQKGRTIGVITTQSFEKSAYTEYHVNLLRNLANYAAIALDNAYAYRKLDATIGKLQSTQTQLVQSEKMASLGELTAGIAHEIQNPLNFVNNFSEVNTELIDELKDELSKGNAKEAAEIADDLKANENKIVEHGQRASDIVKGMLQHSRTSSGEKELTDINALADEYLRLAYHGLRAKDKSFNADFEADLDNTLPKLNVIPQDMGRVILNLINNAFHAVTGVDNPKVVVQTRQKKDSIEIRVSDNGSGIADEIKEKIFQPFFTTKDSGEGTGLGLSLSYDIITKGHGGEIKVESKEGKGTEFSILLPYLKETI